MSSSLRFDNQVVIVTGAGNGLGRSHALLFAARGARVLVNDLGGGISGVGASANAADRVVEEIRAAGGTAVANHDSVEDGDRIVKAAVDAFGTVDIVVNNAGILRDTSFQKMTLDDWNLVQKVHLYGSFRVTHAAWPILREKGRGRVIMTTSAAGIYGNFGQANYAAAKLGILGLANALAIEGRAKGIHVNTIAPIAASRLTETAFPPEFLKSLEPEYVSPLVAWLCHDSCRESGGLFEVGASYFSKLRWERTRGHTFGIGTPFGVDDLAAAWSKVTDFADAEHPRAVEDTFGVISAAVARKPAKDAALIDVTVAATAVKTVDTAYDERDLSLYALGVGARELPFVYEQHPQFAPLPTWAVVQPLNALLQSIKDGDGMLPGLSFGFDRVLHGEQYTEIRAPLPRRARLRHQFRFKAAHDKNPHAVVVIAATTTDETGTELAYNEVTIFVRGGGGFGGERGPSAESVAPPAREPDAVVEEKIGEDQALLYRLSGDWNPLHADPQFAKSFGFDRPILHGLCTYGIVGRHVLAAFAGNDPRRFRSIRVRFSDVVFPGETLVTRMWRESATKIVLEASVKERNRIVIRNAVVDLS